MTPRFQRRMRQAGACLLLGLVVQLATIGWSSPLAFILFVFPGAALVGVGVLIYFLALLARDVELEAGPSSAPSGAAP